MIVAAQTSPPSLALLGCLDPPSPRYLAPLFSSFCLSSFFLPYMFISFLSLPSPFFCPLLSPLYLPKYHTSFSSVSSPQILLLFFSSCCLLSFLSFFHSQLLPHYHKIILPISIPFLPSLLYTNSSSLHSLFPFSLPSDSLMPHPPPLSPLLFTSRLPPPLPEPLPPPPPPQTCYQHQQSASYRPAPRPQQPSGVIGSILFSSGVTRTIN